MNLPDLKHGISHRSGECVTCAPLAALTRKALTLSDGSATLELLSLLRWDYLRENLTEAQRRVMQKAGIPEPIRPAVADPTTRRVEIAPHVENLHWGDWRFHLDHRVHLNRNSSASDFDLFFSLVPQARENAETLRRITLEGLVADRDNNGVPEIRLYDLSILPLNLLLGERVLRYFIPPSDYSQPDPTKKADPYGIIQGQTRAKSVKGQTTAVIDAVTHLLLGAHKFTHTLLFNSDFYCPIGCSDCYKTRMGTREYLAPGRLGADAKSKIYHHPQLGDLTPPTMDNVSQQAKLIVRWMNEDPRGWEVYDVILSGGEPLCMSNATIAAILSEFQHARNLRVLRICTGALFLGLPFRLDDGLADVLKDFSDSTGVRVTIQAHLGNLDMISPETVIAVQRFRQRGISIYSQIPVKSGVNFFLDDLQGTVDSLAELNRRQVLVGVEPYMFIVDMHPSTNAFYVPIEPLMAVWGALVESHDFPGLERPRTLSLLFEGGNIILSGNTLLAMEKRVDRDLGIVTYFVPRVGVNNEAAPVAEVFEYQEPLGPYNEDPESLRKLRNAWLRSQRTAGGGEEPRGGGIAP